jgi:hypothetical protein
MQMSNIMPRFIPHLSEDQIEHNGASLLDDFAQARHVLIEPPIPIDDIVEKHLKLTLEFDDLARMFGMPRDPDGGTDILGALFSDDQRIVIDESVDPYDNPSKEIRLRFILGHEVGHWCLHRVFAKPAQPFLFGGPTPPSLASRSSQAQEAFEWQANHYAYCLLMPRHLLIASWLERFGNSNPRIWRRKSFSLPAVLNDHIAIAFQSDDEALNEFVRLCANKFEVSKFGMRTRLGQIGLLYRSSTTLIHPRGLDFF